ncbi:tyrosine phosphatase [Xylariaceae sp. FL0594]|nr:tyrosine phosphatase [Xylariaceae sp. FL0594]
MTVTNDPGLAMQDLPSPPFIFIPGLPNFRDAGGYEVATDSPAPPSLEGKRRIKMVKRGILFRSSEPSGLTDAGAEYLSQELGIRHVYDLRSAVEISRGYNSDHGFPIREWEGSERKFVPVFLDRDYSPEALALRYKNYASESDQGFVEAYKDILKAAADPTNTFQPFKAILGHLASTSTEASQSGPSPCLVHCTAGKDRTGVIVVLALSLCGVPDEAVVHEYSLTELGLRSRLQELVKHVSNNPKIGIDAAGARRMISARKEAMQETLNYIRAEYGSVEECVLKLGILTPEGIAQLRKNLIVEADEDDAVQWREHAKLVSKSAQDCTSTL